MSANDSDSPDVSIHSDEDWKERVKTEDRKRDEEAAAAHKPSPADEPERFANLPRADFAMLVQMFATQAMTALGLIPAPGAEQPRQQLPLARHFIDLLGVLEEKTRGNLTSQEETLLTTSLHELRLTFVELSRQAGAEQSGTAQP